MQLWQVRLFLLLNVELALTDLGGFVKGLEFAADLLLFLSGAELVLHGFFPPDATHVGAHPPLEDQACTRRHFSAPQRI
jgi:hypothetical protein